MRKWWRVQVLSNFCFSHSELMFFLSQLLSGKLCSPGTLRKKGGNHMGGGQINELVSHSSRAEGEENLGLSVYVDVTGRAGAILNT